MSSPRAPVRSVVALAVLLAAAPFGGCQGGPPSLPGLSALKTDKDLTFAQVQSVSVGLSAAQVRDGFGEPQRANRRADGTFERMEYPALDAKGGKNRLVLDFDARERLVQKTFTGQVLRP
ncbi:MAG: hypothetical protein U1E39_17430 [Planctomycetota bacterium]